MSYGATPAQFAATYPFRRRPGAYSMPYHGAPSYYGGLAMQANPYGSYGIAMPGGYDPSIRTLGMLAGGLYLATMLKKKGMAQKAVGAAGLYLAYTGGRSFLASKGMVAPTVAAESADESVAGLVEDFQGASMAAKIVIVGGIAMLLTKGGVLKKLGIGKKRNGRRRNSRRRNSRRRNSMRRRNYRGTRKGMRRKTARRAFMRKRRNSKRRNRARARR